MTALQGWGQIVGHGGIQQKRKRLMDSDNSVVILGVGGDGRGIRGINNDRKMQ